jgi:hypothetical protein
VSFVAHVGVRGINPAQHHDERWESEVRIVEWSARIIDRDEFGNYIFAEDSVGDEICRFLWERSTRATSGWSNVWPVVVGGSGSSGGTSNGNPGGALGDGEFGAGFVFPGVNTDFTQGDPNINIDFGLGTFTGGRPGLDTGLLFPQPNDPTMATATDGLGPSVATRQGITADEGSGCGQCSSGAGMLPVYNSQWAPDFRFAAKVAAAPPGYPTPHGGYGIALAGTKEWSQEELFFQIDPRLIAVNKSGDVSAASMVCDMTGCIIDPKRTARLQSAFWVLKYTGGTTIALNIGDSGCGDTFGGLVIDSPTGGSSFAGPPPEMEAPEGPGMTVVEPAGGGAPGSTVADMAPEPAKRVAAFLSVLDGGFIDVGSGNCKHAGSEDDDGHKIVHGAHISTKANYRRNDVEDGPFRYEVYDEGDEFSDAVVVRLGWTGIDWAWWTTSPFHWDAGLHIFDCCPYSPEMRPTKTRDVSLPPPRRTLRTPVPTGGGTALDGGTLRGGVGLTSAVTDPPAIDVSAQARSATPTAWDPSQGTLALLTTAQVMATPGILARPQTILGSLPDARFAQGMSTKSDRQKRDSSTPVTGNLASFSGEGGEVDDGYSPTNYGAEGDPHIYTQRPGESKFPGGTGPGGWCILPPEVGLEDYATGYVPLQMDVSTTYFMVGPGAWFGAGAPELANGGLATGWSWGRDDATGDLLFRSHGASTTPDTAIKFRNSSQDISWASGTDFFGTIAHAISADRTWTFPNVSGTLPIGTGGAFQVAVWLDANTLSADSNFTYDGSTVGVGVAFSGSGGGNFVWNESGLNSDFRVEGDNKPNNFLLDASDDEVAIDGRFCLVSLTPAQITADQNDYNPESTASNRSSAWRISSDASRNVTGIAQGLNGRLLFLVNIGAQNIVLQNENASSAAANRIITGTGADVTLAADDTAILWYDSTTARWRLVS